MHGHSVHSGAHAKLAHAEEDVAPLRVDMEALSRLEDGPGRRGQVSRTAKKFRHNVGNRVHHVPPALRVACGLSAGKLGIAFSQPAFSSRLLGALKLRRQLRVCGRITFEFRLPLGFKLCAARDGLAPIGERRVGNIKALIFRKAEKLFRSRDGVRAHGLAVNLVGSSLGTAVADDGPHRDERRSGGFLFRCFDGCFNRFEIVPIRDPLHVPMVGLKTLFRTLSE